MEITKETEVEKKYRVESFDGMFEAIKRLGAAPSLEVFSTHYYAHLQSDNTLKMVDYKNKVEIHRLSTKNGLHTLEEVIALDSIEAGFSWFKAHGYHTLDVLDMHNREYAYKTGGFALYTIDGSINSVVLGYPHSQLLAMEAAFGLVSAPQIRVPYNKYMAQLGVLRSIDLTDD